MKRFGIILLVGGIALLLVGVSEFEEAQNREPEPTEVSLVELEAGHVPDAKWLRINDVWELYLTRVLEWEANEGQTEPNADSPVTEVYVSAFSTEHSVVQSQLKRAQDDDKPQEFDVANLPEMSQFALLSQTNPALIIRRTNFSTYGSVPDNLTFTGTIEGMVRDRSQVDTESMELLAESNVSIDSTLFFDEGKEPTSMDEVIGMWIAGGVMALIGLGLLFKK